MQGRQILTTVQAGDPQPNDYSAGYNSGGTNSSWQYPETGQHKSRRTAWIAGGIILIGAPLVALWLLPKDFFSKSTPIVYQEVTTGIAQRKIIRLPDGTQISLNPQSTVSYPEAFDEKDRSVKLVGEAYFEVAPDAERSFTVRAGNMATTFPSGNTIQIAMIQAYSNQQYLASTLLNGSATVANTDSSAAAGSEPPKPLTLRQNQAAILIPETNEFFSQDFPTAERYLKPRIRGQYRFWGQSPKEVVKELARSYTETIELRGDFQNCRYYGVFQAQEPLEKFLKSFTENINAKLSKEEGNWVITAKGCKPAG